MNDTKLLNWAEFVATKYAVNRDGWVYSRDLGDLEYIRYRSDRTGYNHWTKRVQRLLSPTRLSRRFHRRRPRLRDLFPRLWAYAYVTLRTDRHLPDGQINGIITHWEEDGEYIALFQPRVGVKVIEFLRAEPDHPHAKAIIAEMRAVKELSWPSKRNPT